MSPRVKKAKTHSPASNQSFLIAKHIHQREKVIKNILLQSIPTSFHAQILNLLVLESPKICCCSPFLSELRNPRVSFKEQVTKHTHKKSVTIVWPLSCFYHNYNRNHQTRNSTSEEKVGKAMNRKMMNETVSFTPSVATTEKKQRLHCFLLDTSRTHVHTQIFHIPPFHL